MHEVHCMQYKFLSMYFPAIAFYAIAVIVTFHTSHVTLHYLPPSCDTDEDIPEKGWDRLFEDSDSNDDLDGF